MNPKKQGNSLNIVRHCQDVRSFGRDGKAVEGGGESEDLPEPRAKREA